MDSVSDAGRFVGVVAVAGVGVRVVVHVAGAPDAQPVADGARIQVGCTVGWPTLSPDTQSYTTAGSHTYNIPRNYRYIQLVGVGGGASGQTGHGGINAAGQGGKGGVWASVVLERGVDIPYSEMTLSITVGDGGAQPANSDHAASNPGAATTITSASAGTLTAAGGTGNNPNNQTGLGPGNHTLDGVIAPAGANTTASGNAVPGNACPAAVDAGDKRRHLRFPHTRRCRCGRRRLGPPSSSSKHPTEISLRHPRREAIPVERTPS